MKIAVLGAAIYTNAVINILSVGFILPAAVCDFKMTTIDKGRIAIAHVAGMSIFFPNNNNDNIGKNKNKKPKNI